MWGQKVILSFCFIVELCLSLYLHLSSAWGVHLFHHFVANIFFRLHMDIIDPNIQLWDIRILVIITYFMEYESFFSMFTYNALFLFVYLLYKLEEQYQFLTLGSTWKKRYSRNHRKHLISSRALPVPSFSECSTLICSHCVWQAAFV